jgi:hypothetical protein
LPTTAAAAMTLTPDSTTDSPHTGISGSMSSSAATRLCCLKS